MCGRGFVCDGMVDKRSRDLGSACRARAILVNWGKVLCVPAELYKGGWDEKGRIWEQTILLRFRGPLWVRATPNRAVRVGKTQSACQVVWGRAPVNFKLAYHVNPQCNTNHEVFRKPYAHRIPRTWTAVSCARVNCGNPARSSGSLSAHCLILYFFQYVHSRRCSI